MIFLSKIPGFRSRTNINTTLAIIYYLFILFAIFYSFGDIARIITISSGLLIPYIICGGIDVAKYHGVNRFVFFIQSIILPFTLLAVINIISLLLYNLR